MVGSAWLGCWDAPLGLVCWVVLSGHAWSGESVGCLLDAVGCAGIVASPYPVGSCVRLGVVDRALCHGFP
jgi:hypothetical protein